MIFKEESSWNEATAVCEMNGGHLWTIGSFAEWWNVYQSIAVATLFKEIQTSNTLTTALLFIGLRKTGQVNIIQ